MIRADQTEPACLTDPYETTDQDDLTGQLLVALKYAARRSKHMGNHDKRQMVLNVVNASESPVGARVVAEKLGIGYSTATNILRDLYYVKLVHRIQVPGDGGKLPSVVWCKASAAPDVVKVNLPSTDTESHEEPAKLSASDVSPLDWRVYQFLTSHQGQVFSPREVARELSCPSWTAVIGVCRQLALGHHIQAHPREGWATRYSSY